MELVQKHHNILSVSYANKLRDNYNWLLCAVCDSTNDIPTRKIDTKANDVRNLVLEIVQLISNGAKVDKMTKDSLNRTCNNLLELSHKNNLATKGVQASEQIISIGGVQVKCTPYQVKRTMANLDVYLYPIQTLLSSIEQQPQPQPTYQENSLNNTKEKIESVFDRLAEERLIKRNGEVYEWTGTAIQLDFLLGVLLCQDEAYTDSRGQSHWEIMGVMPQNAIEVLFPQSKNIGKQRRNKKSRQYKDDVRPPIGWEFIYSLAKGY